MIPEMGFLLFDGSPEVMDSFQHFQRFARLEERGWSQSPARYNYDLSLPLSVLIDETEGFQTDTSTTSAKARLIVFR